MHPQPHSPFLVLQGHIIKPGILEIQASTFQISSRGSCQPFVKQAGNKLMNFKVFSNLIP